MSDFTPGTLVAFIVSSVIGILLCVLMVAHGKRRPVDASLSWGEAMAAACFVFFLMFWFYGVIPHQFLTWADTELGWRSDKIVYGPGGILKPVANGGSFPMTITYLAIRDILAVVIYGAGLGALIGFPVWWSKRHEPKADVVPSSSYGRPLVRT